MNGMEIGAGDAATGPILVFGARGWVGAAVQTALAERNADRSRRRLPEVEIVAPTREDVDVADATEVARLIGDVRPQVVMNLAACNPGQGDADRMEAINHQGARHVAAATRAAGARMVFVSSDMVLDGEHAPYPDDAAPQPVNAYGRSKARGERATLDALEDCVAVRTSLVWDPASIDRSTAGFAQQLQDRSELVLFDDEIRMPIARHTLARALVELVDHPFRGVLNVAGRQPLSRHGFGSRLLSWFDIPGRDRVRPGASADLGLARPRDLTLDLTQATSILATPLFGVDEELAAQPSRRPA